MDIGVATIIGIFVVLPAAITVYNLLSERRMKRRAEQLIAFDRIARQLDIGVNQLSIGIVGKAYREGDGRGPLKQIWSVPIYYRPNDGGRGNGMTAKLRLDGTDNTREVEDEFIKMIQLDREYPNA
jgi:hypothetical protein